MTYSPTVGLIGYERSLYTVEEGTGFVEFCINLFEPSDPALIDPIVAVSFFVETVDGMAIGMHNADYIHVITASMEIQRPY